MALQRHYRGKITSKTLSAFVEHVFTQELGCDGQQGRHPSLPSGQTRAPVEGALVPMGSEPNWAFPSHHQLLRQGQKDGRTGETLGRVAGVQAGRAASYLREAENSEVRREGLCSRFGLGVSKWSAASQ